MGTTDEERRRQARRQRRDGRSLVVTDPTLMVRTANERLVLVRDGKVVTGVPSHDIAHVALHGPVTITGAAVARLLDRGVDISLFTSAGRYRGSVSAAASKNVFLMLAQVDAWKRDEKRAAFARAVVASKLAGQRRVLARHARDHGSEACGEAVARIDRIVEKLADEADVDAIRGFEGAGAAAYFGVFGELLRGGWTFPGRVRRPATDPVNALLGFGYTLAVGEVARHLVFAGFDPRVGLLHGLRYGRESLPLDLVEEFRGSMVDTFTLRLLNRGQLQVADFDTDPGTLAVRMTADARRRYLDAWEEMLDRRGGRLPREADDGADGDDDGAVERVGRGGEPPTRAGRGVSWRYRIERQVARLRRFLMSDEPYRPLHAAAKCAKSHEIDSHRPPDEPQPRDTIDTSGED